MRLRKRIGWGSRRYGDRGGLGLSRGERTWRGRALRGLVLAPWGILGLELCRGRLEVSPSDRSSDTTTYARPTIPLNADIDIHC